MAVTVSRARDDRGAAVVMAIGLAAVLAFVAAICVGTVAIVLAHRRAQVAADLASLAAAGALQRGSDACDAATMIAGRHDAALTACAVDGLSVTVAATVELPAALGGSEVAARARAGPAGPVIPGPVIPGPVIPGPVIPGPVIPGARR